MGRYAVTLVSILVLALLCGTQFSAAIHVKVMPKTRHHHQHSYALTPLPGEYDPAMDSDPDDPEPETTEQQPNKPVLEDDVPEPVPANAVPHDAQPMHLHIVDEIDAAAAGARCLDGSPPAFYYQRYSTPAAANSWIIYFGDSGDSGSLGWCDSEASCLRRANSASGHGSSAHNRWSTTRFGSGVLSDDPLINPKFFAWNKLYLISCDGSSFTGNRVDPYQVDEQTTLYMRGRSILDYLLTYWSLDESQHAFKPSIVDIDAIVPPTTSFRLAEAAEVLISGCGTGGLAALLAADDIAGRLHSNHKAIRSGTSAHPVTIKVLVDSGVYLSDVAGRDNTHTFRQHAVRAFRFHNATGGVDAECLMAFASTPSQQWKCWLGVTAIPYVHTPLMIVQSHNERWSVRHVLAVPTAANANGVADAYGGNPGQGTGGDNDHDPRQQLASEWIDCTMNGPDHNHCSPSDIAILNSYSAHFLESVVSNATAVTSVHMRHTRGNALFVDSCMGHCLGESDRYWSELAVGGVVLRDAVSDWWSGVVTRPAPDGGEGSILIDCELNPTAPHMCNPTCADAIHHHTKP